MAFGNQSGGTQAFASTLTDLMTSLAVIFILLLVVFLRQSHEQSNQAKDQVRENLQPFLDQKSLALKQDPEDPLRLTVMVSESQLRFPLGSAKLSNEGGGFVRGLFQNLGQKICDPKIRDKVDSIVIEGHTDMKGEETPEGVRRNIALSQRRSFSVLETGLSGVQSEASIYDCLLKLMSANGRGSRNPILVNNLYVADLSRRVEIKIQVRSAEQQFKAIAESAKPQALGTPSGPNSTN